MDNQPTHVSFRFYKNDPSAWLLIGKEMLPVSFAPRAGDYLEIELRNAHRFLQFHTLKVVKTTWVYETGPSAPILNSLDIYVEAE